MAPVHTDTDAHLVPVDASRVQAITRPDRQLWTLFIIYSVMANVAFPLVILPYYFRYITLRYRFDDDGVSVSHGLIWRRETYLTYARIQDIHVTRNIFERWLGIGTVKIQTASGSAAATESIAGLIAFQDVRNYLYARMRGHRSAPLALARDMQRHSLRDGSRDGLRDGSSVGLGDGLGDGLGGDSRVGAPDAQSLRTHASADDAVALDALTGIRDELRAVRELLEKRR